MMRHALALGILFLAGTPCALGATRSASNRPNSSAARGDRRGAERPAAGRGTGRGKAVSQRFAPRKPRLAPTRPSNGTPVFDLVVDKHYYLADEEYENIRDVSLKLLDRYPPSEYLYVGVGRSPTPFIAFLKNLNPKLALNLPITGLSGSGTRKQALSAAAKKEFLAHFDRFVPAEELAGRKILLIDFTHTGGTLGDVSRLVSSHLEAKGADTAVVPVGLAHDEGAIERLRDSGVTHDLIDISEQRMVADRILRDKYYRTVAEYDGYRPGKNDPESLEPRSEHALFSWWLRQRMAGDRKLNRFPLAKAGEPSAGSFSSYQRLSGASSRPAEAVSNQTGDKVVLRSPRRGVEQGVRVHQAIARLAERLSIGETVPQAWKVIADEPNGRLAPGDEVMVTSHVGDSFVEGGAADAKTLGKVPESLRLRAAVIDVLSHQLDRKLDNVLVGTKGQAGTIRLIDHDVSFGAIFDGRAGQAHRSVFFRGGALGYRSAQKSFEDLPPDAQSLVLELSRASRARIREELGLEDDEARVLKAAAVSIRANGLTAAIDKAYKGTQF